MVGRFSEFREHNSDETQKDLRGEKCPLPVMEEGPSRTRCHCLPVSAHGACGYDTEKHTAVHLQPGGERRMKRFYFEEEGIHSQELHVPLYRRASAQDVLFIGIGLFVLSYLIVFYLFRCIVSDRDANTVSVDVCRWIGIGRRSSSDSCHINGRSNDFGYPYSRILGA